MEPLLILLIAIPIAIVISIIIGIIVVGALSDAGDGFKIALIIIFILMIIFCIYVLILKINSII